MFKNQYLDVDDFLNKSHSIVAEVEITNIQKLGIEKTIKYYYTFIYIYTI
jgi:hypothetical protein